MNAIEALEQIKSRGNCTRWGIGFASEYLQQCSPSDIGMESDAWQKQMEEAAEKLVWCHRDLVIDSVVKSALGEETRDKLAKVLELPSMEKGVSAKDAPAGSVLVFDYVITTKDEDRDGDVLDPSGATLDESRPLLFNHISSQPIGRPLKTLQQNGKRIKVRSAIMGKVGDRDFPLGMDVAALVEFGALRRMSHGFLPDFETIEPREKDDEVVGWHIGKYEIMEDSVVSVASNRGALIEAWNLLGEKAFATPWAKSMAENAYKTRPVVIKSAIAKTESSGEHPATKTAIPYRAYPPMDQGAGWSAPDARRRIQAWAKGSDDKLDLSKTEHRDKYREAFAFVDGFDEYLQSYKFPHHDVVDGSLKTNYRGCISAIQVLNGGRGGTTLNDADKQSVYNHVAKHVKAGWDVDPPELKCEIAEPKHITRADIIRWTYRAGVDDLSWMKTLVDHQLQESNKRLMREHLGIT